MRASETVIPDMRPLDPDLARAWRRRSALSRRPSSSHHPPGREERRAERRFPIANTEIRNHAASGQVLDLSRDGMAIESHQAVRPGRRYTFTLTIGDHVETLAARVLWCRLQTTRRLPNGDVLPVYRAGIERLRPHAPNGAAESEPGAERVPEPDAT